MIERLIFLALQAGVAEVLRRPEILERYFAEQHLLDATEIAAIRGLFEAQPPQIIHSYPRHDSSFPLYAIVLGGESESQQYLGDAANDLFVEGDRDDGSETTGAIWEHTFMVFVATEHPDATRYYYELAKFFLFRALEYFKENEVLEARFSGNDLAPDPRYIPAHLFVRQITVTMVREHNQIGTRPARAFQVAGVHVDDGETVDVETGITISEE